MPTEDQILVPETLLKKRKSQEKQREERSAEYEKKKKVSVPVFYICIPLPQFCQGGRVGDDGDDKDHTSD